MNPESDKTYDGAQPRTVFDCTRTFSRPYAIEISKNVGYKNYVEVHNAIVAPIQEIIGRGLARTIEASIADHIKDGIDPSIEDRVRQKLKAQAPHLFP